MIIGNSVGALWHISIYTVFIIPIVFILLIRKKATERAAAPAFRRIVRRARNTVFCAECDHDHRG